MSRKGNNTQVLNYLSEHKTITDIECRRVLKFGYVAQRIYDLRNMGYDIITHLKGPFKPCAWELRSKKRVNK